MYRPGGLTALAVFNFIIGGWNAIRLLLVMVALGTTLPHRGDAPMPPHSLLYAQLFYLLGDAALLIASGVGYLKLKRVLGRWIGTADALWSIAFFGVALSITRSAGFPFSLSSLTMLVYPGVTLVLLNVVFRENLVN